MFTFLTPSSNSVCGYSDQNLIGGIDFNAPNKFDLAVIWEKFANNCSITQVTSSFIRIF